VREIVADAGEVAMADVGLSLAFDVHEPNVVRFLEQRAQRFAVEVNETTWTNLKGSLAEGIEAGESIPELAQRVENVMGDRIRSSGTTIARTEVIGASNGGTQLSWEQSGVVAGKEWLAAIDERTRETHVEAHGQQVRLDADFSVGDGSGPQPGQIGLAEEDINCRCTSVAILDIDWRGE
jgi:SPP1 gp7 family putative phage head morphogenesis protein